MRRGSVGSSSRAGPCCLSMPDSAASRMLKLMKRESGFGSRKETMIEMR